MSVQEKIEGAAAAETASPVTAPDPRAPGADPIAAMFAGFGEFCESPLGKIALLGSKVLLFNVFLWGPIAALGYMIFFW
ncbi:MAG: hypothetical protein AAF192_14785 [Pseudomonadota bacterium]